MKERCLAALGFSVEVNLSAWIIGMIVDQALRSPTIESGGTYEDRKIIDAQHFAAHGGGRVIVGPGSIVVKGDEGAIAAMKQDLRETGETKSPVDQIEIGFGETWISPHARMIE